MFANDQGWSHKLHEAVATGLTAEAAVERVQSDTRARMLRSTDPYLRDRLHDLEDLGYPPDAPARRPGPRAVARASARQCDPDRARDGPGGAARLRPQAPARPRAGGRHRQFSRLHRGARARHSRSRRNPERARHRRSRRRHHRRRHHGRYLCAPVAGDRIGFCRARAIPRTAAGAISGIARETLRHQGRPEGRADDQRGARHRPAAYRRDRQRRHRPVPHRTAVHGLSEPAALERSACALSHRARCRRPQARHLPHARYRRRQGTARIWRP